MKSIALPLALIVVAVIASTQMPAMLDGAAIVGWYVILAAFVTGFARLATLWLDRWPEA